MLLSLVIFLIGGLILLTSASKASFMENIMANTFPELASYSPPDWCQTGRRLSYYVSSATIPDGHYVYYRDEYGEWIDSEGNRYSKGEGESASGEGIMQVNMVAKGALDIHLFSYQAHRNSLTCLGEHLSVTGLPSCTGDFWLPPEFLASLKEGYYHKLGIIRLPYQIGGKTYQAIRFHHDNGKIVYVYDLNTGLLLYYGGAGPGPLSHLFDKELARATSTYLSQVVFLETREIQWPWQDFDAPSWLEEINYLQYSGAVTQIIPGSPLFPIGLQVEIEVLDRGYKWIQHYSRTCMVSPPGMPPALSESIRVSGVGQVGGLWLPPEGLKELEPGQILDRDPLTGVVTRVSDRGIGEDGTPLVVIEEGVEGNFTNIYFYHQREGILLTWIHHQKLMERWQELYLQEVK